MDVVFVIYFGCFFLEYNSFNDEWYDDNLCFNFWLIFCCFFLFGDFLCGVKLFWVIYVKNKD